MTVKAKIFGCGGSGMNIAHHWTRFMNKITPGFTEVEPVFIDTSDSNVVDGMPQEQIYLIENRESGEKLKGGGKIRATNYDDIVASMPDFLFQHRPAAINFVVHSTGGGSGSVVGPILVNELLERGEQVIVVVIGTISSGKEIENTIRTLASYDSVAEGVNAPVNVFYRENSINKSRKVIDDEVIRAITFMTAMFSGDNRELDNEDCKNFLYYNRSTRYPAALSHLDLFSKTIELEKGNTLISLLTLTDDDTPSDSNIPAEYQAVGFAHENAKKGIGVGMPIHAAITSGFFQPLISKLTKQQQVFDDQRSLATNKSIVPKTANVTAKRIVL